MPDEGGLGSLHRYSSARAMIVAEPVTAGPSGLVSDLRRLCGAMSAHLSRTGAALSLMSATGSIGVAAASDERCRRLDELQFTTGEGPCHEAFARRRPVLTPDLNAPGRGRWPGYRSAVVESGVRAVFAFPLHVGAVGLGVVDLYSTEAGSLDPEQLATALTFAEIATEILLDGGLVDRDGGLDPGLAQALDSRAEVHQAQGMVMVSMGVTLVEALILMRAHAFARSQPLIDLARQIIDGDNPLSKER